MKAFVFDRMSGRLEGSWDLRHRAALADLSVGARATRFIHHHGLSIYCRVLNATFPPDDITLRLSHDSLFGFPFGDAYWTRLLDPSSTYEPEIDAFLRAAAGIDYRFIDCGA